jgi:AAA domain
MDKTADGNLRKPKLYSGDLANPPAALQPLLTRPQWAIWRLIWDTTHWTKPPFQARDPQRHASSADPNTWTDYSTAVAAAAAHGDGVTYVLTPNDELGAADIDHVRDPATGGITEWAQRLIDQAERTYVEISPSGTGLRIWGTAIGTPVHRSFNLENGAKLELFRRTPKPLTVTGLQLGRIRQFSSLDQILDRAVIWAERHKTAPTPSSGAGTTISSGMRLSIEEIEEFVRTSPAPVGGQSIRSEIFHIVVGHFRGCGWTPEQIYLHLAEFPDGVGGRYLAEGRLSSEIERSLRHLEDYSRRQQQIGPDRIWTNDWKSEPAAQQSEPTPLPWEESKPESKPAPELEPEQKSEAPELEPEIEEPKLEEPELEPDLEIGEPASDLPPMFCHGDPDPRPIKSWLVKGLIPATGCGLLSGQWGTGKTFLALELASALMTGQPFLGRLIKRQCGVLFLPAESADEVRLRLEAMVREKCGSMSRAPFRWYETVPVLLQRDAADKLIAMGRQAHESMQAEFGLPLGLIIIDTVAASAGYSTPGAESDSSVGQALMNTLRIAGHALTCFSLGVDHFGKSIETGTRGTSAKESASDLVLACLGERELSGRVLNTRLTVRKCRGGPQGMEFPFTLRVVESAEPDEDGEPITTLVVDWQSGPGVAQRPPNDPWGQGRRADQRTAALRLKRVLMAVLADRGVDLPISPGGPIVRMVDQEIVREEFYAQTAADGTAEQKAWARRKQFNRVVDWAEAQQLIGVREINSAIHFWLARPEPSQADI